MERQKKFFSPDNISFGLVLGLAFLLPIFFLPIAGVSLDIGKMFFLSVITLIAFVLWMAGRFMDGMVKIPKSSIVGLIFIIAIVFIVSSVFSPVPTMSIFGQGFEVGTAAFILMAALLTLVVSITVDSRDKVFRVYLAFLAAFAFLAIHHIIRLFAGADTMSFGIFTEQLSSAVGKWNDLGIFFGLVSVLSFLTLEIIDLSRLYRYLLYGALALSLFFLTVINFTLGWVALAVVSAVFFIYQIYLNNFERAASGIEEQRVSTGAYSMPWFSLTVLVISVLFAFTSATLGSFMPSYFKTTQVEVRPSFATTFDVAKDTLKENLLLGSGPNRFSNEWQLYKPDELNSTIFWATNFNAGVGLIPTFAVTTGLLGILAWILFFAAFLYKGVKAMMFFGISKISRYLALSSFLSASYLWIFTIFYVPNVVVTALAFVMTGIFVAVLSIENMSEKFEFSLLGNPKLGFASVLIFVFLIVASVALGYVFVKNTISVIYFQKAVTTVNSGGNIDTSESALLRAASLNPSDVYYRGLSQISVSRINTLFQQQDIKPEDARTQFTALMGNAIQSSKQAIDYDTTNYVNWMNLGGIYEAVVPLGVAGAYDEALKSYNEAIKYSPKDPSIYFTLARLEVSNKNTKDARTHLNKALSLKNNYTEALFFLSQIEASEGNVKEAINRADQASLLAPNDVGLFFQLGLLKYTNKDYQGSILALERATSLTADYANAMYFLGLSYDKAGRNEDAIKQFTRIKELNPENKEVNSILNNLIAGKDAFFGVPPPDNTPEKKTTPPIKEDNSSGSGL